jgi:GxxExxY protein
MQSDNTALVRCIEDHSSCLNLDSGDGRISMMLFIDFHPFCMSSSDMQHSDLTHRIIGCAMRVHSELGNGFQEVIYQRALAIEMEDAELAFSREHEMDIHYLGHHIGTRRVDFLVDGVIMVELKAVIRLEDVHLAQAMNYVEAYNLNIGLLLNFGARSLEYKRVHNNKLTS